MPLDLRLNTLAVHLYGRRVGVINRLAGDQHLFSFDEDFVEDGRRETLSLSFKGRSGGLVTRVRPVSRRLPPFFSNLLPEGHLRTYLAEQAGVKPEREFFLLAMLGSDLSGAVTVTPLRADGHPMEPLESREPIRRENEDGVLRFSLAGVQLKFSAILEAAGGLTVPANGTGGHWIVKLPSTQFRAVPENEFAMLALARAIGIQVPETRLVDVQEIRGIPQGASRLLGRALVVRRFDREADGSLVHMEDFAQVFGLFPDDKYGHRSYANLAAVLRAEGEAQDTEEFFRRLVFSVLIGNGDMHLKNWSLLHPRGGRTRLSPAYDFVATAPYLPGDKLALRFGGSSSLKEITADQIRRFADTAGLPVHPLWELHHQTREATWRAWRSLPERDVLPDDLHRLIDQWIQSTAGARMD